MKIPKTMKPPWVYKTFEAKGKGGEQEVKISEVRMGESQVIERKQNTCGRKTLARQLRNGGTPGQLADFATFNAN